MFYFELFLSYDMHGMISWMFKKHDPELNWANLRHRLYIINMHHNKMQMWNKTAVAFDISDQGFAGRSPSWFPSSSSGTPFLILFFYHYHKFFRNFFDINISLFLIVGDKSWFDLVNFNRFAQVWPKMIVMRLYRFENLWNLWSPLVFEIFGPWTLIKSLFSCFWHAKT